MYLRVISESFKLLESPASQQEQCRSTTLSLGVHQDSHHGPEPPLVPRHDGGPQGDGGDRRGGEEPHLQAQEAPGVGQQVPGVPRTEY